MSNFDKYTNYRNDAGVSGVVFGAEKTVLEVELNEMQEISKNMLRDLIKNVIGDGITDISKITYNDGMLNIGECCIIVDGILINCSGLSLAVESDTTAYLQVWEDTEEYSATLQASQDRL